jgi:hypothetical protein
VHSIPYCNQQRPGVWTKEELTKAAQLKYATQPESQHGSWALKPG